MTDIRLSPGEWKNCGVEPEVRCLGKTEHKNGEKVKKKIKRQGDKL
jgi:hypothetical protein